MRAQRSRRERLAVLNTHATVVALTAGVIAVVIALIVYGYWDSYLRPARETVVSVGSESYNMTYFVRRIKQEINDNPTLVTQPSLLFTLPTQLATDIIDEETAVQRAAGTLGVAVSDDDIDREIASRVRAIVNTDQSGHVVRSPNLQIAVQESLKESGLTLAQYRRSVHGQLLLRQIEKHFEDQIGDSAPQVHPRLIVVSDEAKAKDLKQQLDNGADFGELAKANTEDSTLKDQGGLRDWTLKGWLPGPVDEAAFSLPVGKVSDPIQADGKWYLVKVEERSDNREVTAQQKSDLANKQKNDWLDEQSKQLKARSSMDDQARQQYALDHSGALDKARNASSSGGQTSPINLPPVGSQVPSPVQTPSPGQAPQPGGTP